MSSQLSDQSIHGMTVEIGKCCFLLPPLPAFSTSHSPHLCQYLYFKVHFTLSLHSHKKGERWKNCVKISTMRWRGDIWIWNQILFLIRMRWQWGNAWAHKADQIQSRNESTKLGIEFPVISSFFTMLVLPILIVIGFRFKCWRCSSHRVWINCDNPYQSHGEFHFYIFVFFLFFFCSTQQFHRWSGFKTSLLAPQLAKESFWSVNPKHFQRALIIGWKMIR